MSDDILTVGKLRELVKWLPESWDALPVLYDSGTAGFSGCFTLRHDGAYVELT